MNCDDARRALDEGLRSDALERHLGLCPECAAIERALDTKLSVPAGLFDALAARLPQRESTEMNCETARAALHELLEGGDSSSGLARHLSDCAECRAERDRLAAIERELDAPALDRVDVRPDFVPADDVTEASCERVQEALASEVGPLPPSMAAHLADCPPCLTTRDRLSAIERVLDRPAIEDVALTPAFTPAEDHDHASCADVLRALVERPEASSPLAPSMAAHLAGCDDCAEARARLSAIDRALDRPAVLTEHVVRPMTAPQIADVDHVDCETVERALVELPESDGVPAAVGLHLASCASCQAARDRLAAIERTLDRPAVMCDVPEGLGRTIVGRVHLERARRPAPLRAWLAAAAMLLAALVGGWNIAKPAAVTDPVAALASVDRSALRQRITGEFGAGVGKLKSFDMATLASVDPGSLSKPSALTRDLGAGVGKLTRDVRAAGFAPLTRPLQGVVNVDYAWSIALALLLALFGANAFLLRIGNRS